ncbi:MAG: OB-fold domain-containing protein [Pseudomonadales bacterium]|nr:OB-fold domain-containing protein [Pseudomonadales bacterium]
MTNESFIPNPPPRPNHYLDEQFWENCRNHVLAFQCCTSCETWRHIPRFMCAKCGSPDWEWRQSSGKGIIYSWTVVHKPMTPHFESIFPYAALVVEMEEGVRITAGLQDLDLDKIEMDLPVEVVFETLENGAVLPFFVPRKD